MNHRRILSGIVALVAIVGVGSLFFFSRIAKPLTYQGKSIDYWFRQLPMTPVPPPGIDLGNVRGFAKSMGHQYGGTNITVDASFDAIEAFGTNALPFLMARLQGADTVVKKQITAVATNAGVAYLPFRKAELERLQAVTGLIQVKTLTSETRQLIVALRTNGNPDIAAAAAYVLKRRATLKDAAPDRR